MEHRGMDEIQYYNLPREARARMIAHMWIKDFASLVYQWENSRKGDK